MDVKLGGKGISIKTITSSGAVKVSWTVDRESSRKFVENYKPLYDIVFVKINWGSKKGGFYLIPLSSQQEIFKSIGRENYLKLPKEETNPRGVEFSRDALRLMLGHRDILRIEVDWQKGSSDYDVYKRWFDRWAE